MASRVERAIQSLTVAFAIDAPKEERDELLNGIRERLTAHPAGERPHAYGQVADLIKQRFWRDQNDPEAAVKFGNLYSQLIAKDVLNRKQSLLWFLHLLATAPDGEQSTDNGDGDSFASAEPALPPLHRPATRSPPAVDGAGSQVRDAERTPRPKAPRPSDGSVLNGSTSSPTPQSPPPRMDLKLPSNEPDDERNSVDEEEEPASGAPPTALELLRDLPFTLQGLSSNNFEFGPQSTLGLPRTLSLPIISLLHALAEPSLLYRSLSEFTESAHDGLVSQSLRAAIGIELRSYLGLIATLEGEIRRTITATAKGNESARGTGVTLKRCVVWTRDSTMGLRLMSSMMDESRSKAGGQLISLIHSYTTSYGDPFVNAFAERMLAHLTRPFYDMVRQWIYDGELHDPYHEFFVVKQRPGAGVDDVDLRRPAASSVWESEYKLSKDLVPSIVTDDLARKVFLIGKSLNFLRHGCGDADWVDTYSKDSSQELRYGDTAGLEASIDRAYKTTMARLIHLMDSKFGLHEHLMNLKRFLLLGQGDFIALLMDSLAPNLERPAGSLYRHTLTAQLDHAIRGSNAKFGSAEIFQRLDARLLELSHGDIGWDVFTLEYRVDAPVDVVITNWASRQYLKVFNFLWRIKRVEFALGTSWRRVTIGARGVLAAVEGRLAREWKATRCCIAEMIHFVSQLQNYILFEVIEASWNTLQAALAAPGHTLDDLIAAHTAYLNDITHKGLLGAGARDDSFMSQLHHLLKILLAYRDAVDGLFSYSVADFTRRQQALAARETQRGMRIGSSSADADVDLPVPGDRLRRKEVSAAGAAERDADSLGLAGFVLDPTAAGDDQMLPALQKRLGDLAVDFRARLAVLLGDLLAQPDPDIKFLGMNMNFNGVYRPQRRSRREGKERRAPPSAAGQSEGQAVKGGA